MSDRVTSFAAFAILSAIAITGCKKEDTTPPANQPGQYPQQPGAYQQPGYQQPGAAQPGYAQPVAAQPGYQQPVAAQPGYQQPVATQPVATQPVATQPAAGAAPASPPLSPLAIVPCSNDAGCVGAKCNVAAGKCQFPCGSNNDCQPGWACNVSLGPSAMCIMSGQTK